ncbi:MAG: GTP cyclohydrolase FolE2 [Planctomycetota bacterium]
MQVLPDVQAYADSRNLKIDKVGVTQVPWPFRFSPTSKATELAQSTVGSVDMFVTLPADKKGTHMSRFVQLLRDCDQTFHYENLIIFFRQLQERLGASQVSGTLRFPFFMERSAPVTGELGKLQIQVAIDIELGEKSTLRTTIKGPATSLCPCSKEISAYGAHNQRCELSASVVFEEGCEVGVDELFEMIEKAASCSVYPTLKRTDEKSVTEAAYDNPKFVEDIVRDMAVILKEDSRIAWFRCGSENFESIHQHNAFAQIEFSRSNGQ